jgi:hypothetical protein
MVKHGSRRILIAQEAPVVQNALYTLLEGVESNRDASHSTRERLKAIAKEGRDRLILELQAVDQPFEGISPRVKNIRFDHPSKVAVVTCELANYQIAHQIDEFCRPHFFPKHVLFSLGVFVHALFGLF